MRTGRKKEEEQARKNREVGRNGEIMKNRRRQQRRNKVNRGESN